MTNTGSSSGHGSKTQPLTWGQRRFLLVLALPALGIAFAYTVVTTYVPVLLNELSGPGLTGVLIGGEGVLAIVIPTLIGGLSDRVRTRLGGRLPFLLAGGAIAIVALVLMPLGAGSLTCVSVTLAGFFIGYFVYYAPYYALYPDLVADSARGRSQGFQGGLRSAGLLLALAGGGVLLNLWRPLPFVLAAAVIVAVTGCLFVGIQDRLRRAETTRTRGNGVSGELTLLREKANIRRWMVANACWEAAIAALRTFVVLYFTSGLGLSLQDSSGALALVGLAAVIAAPISGALADRFGPRPIMLVAVCVFGPGLIPPLLTTNTAYIAAILPVAFAAVVLMTLPYSMLMGLLPRREEHGAGAALFGLSRGVGVIAGPLLAGLAVEVFQFVPVLSFADTQGYSAIFGVASALLLVSIPIVRRIS